MNFICFFGFVYNVYVANIYVQVVFFNRFAMNFFCYFFVYIPIGTRGVMVVSFCYRNVRLPLCCDLRHPK